jgi:hypothetical protein
VGWHAPVAGFPSAGWKGELELGSIDYASPIAWTTTFVQFFQDTFLEDKAVNMMLHWIRLQVQHDITLHKTTIIGDLAFTNALLKNFALKTPMDKAPTVLTNCKDEIKHLGWTRLFLLFIGMSCRFLAFWHQG